MMFVCVCVIGGGVLIMSCNPMRNGPNVWHDTEITKETDICSPKFSQKSVSSLMSTFSKIIFNKLSDSTPPSPHSSPPISRSTAYLSLHAAISSTHHHYWGPFVWRSYPSSSPAWIHPLASSSQMTPSCRWPDRWRERGRRRETGLGWVGEGEQKE